MVTDKKAEEMMFSNTNKEKIYIWSWILRTLGMIMRPDLRICGIEAGAEIKSGGIKDLSIQWNYEKFSDSRERKRDLQP